MSTKARPLSPHLQVYRWYFSMFLSIMHRATGFALAVGALLVTWWLMAAATGVDSFIQFHDFTGSLLGRLMLAGWLYALVFHFLNGIRHLVWDFGFGFAKKTATLTGYVVFGLSIALTALIWCGV